MLRAKSITLTSARYALAASCAVLVAGASIGCQDTNIEYITETQGSTQSASGVMTSTSTLGAVGTEQAPEVQDTTNNSVPSSSVSMPALTSSSVLTSSSSIPTFSSSAPTSSSSQVSTSSVDTSTSTSLGSASGSGSGSASGSGSDTASGSGSSTNATPLPTPEALVLSVELPGPPLPLRQPRVLIAQVNIASREAVMAGAPVYSLASIIADTPASTETPSPQPGQDSGTGTSTGTADTSTNAGTTTTGSTTPKDPAQDPPGARFELQIPAPPIGELDPALLRGPQYMIALYDDQDGDQTWTQADGFVAAAPALVFYDAHAQSWVSWSSLDRHALMTEQPTSATGFMLKIQGETLPGPALTLRRFDAARPKISYGGTMVNPAKFDGTVSFLTSVGLDETSDLAQGFIAGPRPLDLALRSTPGVTAWSIQSQDLRRADPFDLPGTAQAFIRQGLPVAKPPGLLLDELLAWPLAGYWRPLGAPLPKPTEYLTVDSTLVAPVCWQKGTSKLARAAVVHVAPQGGELAASTNTWFSAPIGALYAAVHGLAPGSVLGLYRLRNRDLADLFLVANQSLADLQVSTDQCGGLVRPPA